MRTTVLIVATVFAALSAFAGVSVSSPTAGSTVGSPVHFVASASSSANSIASIVVYVDGNKMYTKYASSIDTYISLGTGSHYVVTKAWDNSGNVFQDTRTIYVGSTSTSTSTSSGSGVYISSPSNGATTSSPVHFVASATPSGSYPIASMKMYVDGNDGYLTYSNKMDTYVNMGTGSHSIVIKAWDTGGHVYSSSETINVGSSTTSSTSTSTSTSVGMHVSSPSNGSTVGSSVTLSASATGYNPISSIAVYVDGNSTALVYSSSVNKTVTLGSGGHTAVFRAWDSTGKTYSQTVNFTVSGSTSTSTSSSSTSSSSGNTIYAIQAMSGWQSCSSCASTTSGTGGKIAGYSMSQYIGSPSLDGKSSKFSIWGSTPYADVLWYKSLTSTMGSAASSAHHFIYDAYFYIDKPQYAQSIEFDINQYVNGHSLVFGTQCNLLNGHQWDYWNNQNEAWVHSGIYCGTPSAYTWHHVILEVERVSGDELHYISVTLDGNKQYYDKYVAPRSSSWTGVTVNFQLDGDYAQHAYNVWVDKFNFIYW
jgi:hypothetical protein